MIRPMVRPPCLQGFNDFSYPLYKGDYWIDDTNEDILKGTWKRLVEKVDSMGTLEIEEKYVEIELPKPEVTNVKSGDVVFLKFDIDKVDLELACEYAKAYTEILPKDVAVALLPSIDTEIIDKEEVYDYLDKLKEKINEIYKK